MLIKVQSSLKQKRTIMANEETRKVGIAFWVIAAAALIWNAMGGDEFADADEPRKPSELSRKPSCVD